MIYTLGFFECIRKIKNLHLESVIEKKCHNGDLYVFRDLFLDSLLFIKKIFTFKISICFSLIFILGLLIFSVFSLVFIILYVWGLIILWFIIGCGLIFKADFKIPINSYYDGRGSGYTIYNIIIIPWHWAKLTSYAILSFKRSKIQYPVLEQILIGKLFGLPFWAIKCSYFWTIVVYDIIFNGSFKRKKILRRPKIFITELKEAIETFVWIKSSFAYNLSKDNKFIIKHRKLSLNQLHLQEMLDYLNKISGPMQCCVPFIVKVGGLEHQALRTSSGSYLIFTSKSSYALSTKEQFSNKNETVETVVFGKKKVGYQYFGKTLLDPTNLEFKYGYLRSFLIENNLQSFDNLTGFFIRASLMNNFTKWKYFVVQDSYGEGYITKLQSPIYGIYYDMIFHHYSIKNFLTGSNIWIKSGYLKEYVDAGYSSASGCQEEGKLDKETIERALGELQNIPNDELFGELKQIYPEMADILKDQVRMTYSSERYPTIF